MPGSTPRTDTTAAPVHALAAQPPAQAGASIEIVVAAQIAHAFLSARHPVEVCRFALARVAPLLGARFGSVYLWDGADPATLRLHCAYNWPQSSARYLGQLRIRESRGPTGVAAAKEAVVEVPDVFADPVLQDWWEPARELGFVSIIALPLRADRVAADAVNVERAEIGTALRETIGAVSFYFDSPRRFHQAEKRLLRLVADQLAAAAAKGRLMQELRATNEELRASNEALRRRLDEFEAARRVKDEFLATVTHELRTPLTSILGFGDLLSTGLCGELNEQQHAAVSRIDASARLLLRLITDMVDLAQLKLGVLRAAPARHDGVMLARRALEEAGAAPAGIEVSVRALETGTIVVTDGEKVVRILAHLLRNAFKFTTRGSVTVTVARRVIDAAEYIEWSVRDTGAGIAAPALELIFEEFRQADGSRTRPFGGAGVGLALARRLATLLGGAIVVESKPGKGSTFTLRLPTAPLPN